MKSLQMFHFNDFPIFFSLCNSKIKKKAEEHKFETFKWGKDAG